MKIKSKHIVITGAASGIGLELVNQLYKHNKISVIARPSSSLTELKRSLPELKVHEADLSDPVSVERAAHAIIQTDQQIDILINNAAVQHTPHFLDEAFEKKTIREEIEVNLVAPCTLIFLLMPLLVKNDRSIILNLNSGLGLVPKTSSAIYCGTKGALNIFSQSLRHQLAHTNVQVKQAFLPLVDTKMTQGRGSGKLTAHEAASRIIAGLGSSKPDFDIGKSKILRLLMRLSPSVAASIMKRA